MKRVVLFDFHNTLVTCDCWLDLEIRTLPGLVIEKLVGRRLLEVDPGARERATGLFKALRQRVRESGVELSALEGTLLVLRQMNIQAAEEDVARAVRELEEMCLDDVEPLPGVPEALEGLRNAGYLLGVVSSAGYPLFVELALESQGLRSLFNEVITSAGEGIYKSDPEIYRRAVDRLGALPEEAIHVGDHPDFDVEAARKAGLSTVWLTAYARRTATIRGEPWRNDEVGRSNADAVIANMDELFDAVHAISEATSDGGA